jgi:DNA modification methylase
VGSGTTGMVATERGVDWVGIDISEPYLNTAAQRIAPAQRGIKAPE